MKPGEIYLANFPFGGGGAAGMKLRPVLLLTLPLGPVPEVLVAYISSVVPPAPIPTDLVLNPAQPEHSMTNLKVKSVLRLHKLATIHQQNLTRRLGALSAPAWGDVQAKLRRMLSL